MNRSAPPDDAWVTVDQLAASAGLTVRTTRYYAGLGLLPPPQRRGRVAWYGPQHRARLQLIRALQDHGFTLAAIERYLGRVPLDASVEDLALQRAMLTPWTGERHETLSRRALADRAGRALTDEEVGLLERLRAVRREGSRFEPLPPFDVTVQILDLDIPVEAMVEAGEAIDRHMDALADELTAILRTDVLAPFRQEPHSEEEKARFERTLGRLRELTLQAVVAGFQRAANQVITRSLSGS